jgi:hypothetical protein
VRYIDKILYALFGGKSHKIQRVKIIDIFAEICYAIFVNRSCRMNKAVPFFILCAMPVVCVLLTQCGDWNASLLAPIRQTIAEQGSIKEIQVTTYPSPFKFNKDTDAPAVWGDPNWEKAGWEKRYGLVISGTSLANETRVLAPAEYVISPLNTAEPGVQTVTVTLNDTHLYPNVTTSFYILIADRSGFPEGEVIYNGTTFGSLSGAITAAGTSDNPSVVYVVADVITVADPLTISNGKHIILTVLGNATIRRGSANGSLFTIESGASLTLDTGDSLELTLDGCKLSADAPLVKVSGGELIMGRGVTLQNNHNDKTSNTGGGVYVSSGGRFTMTDGVISGNKATNRGSGVYLDNDNGNNYNAIFTMSGNAVVNQEVYLADGMLITVSDRLTLPEGVSAIITRGNTGGGHGNIVLRGEGTYKLTEDDVAKFAPSGANTFLFPDISNNRAFFVEPSGEESKKNAVYIGGNGVPSYGTLQEAISSAGGSEAAPAPIYVANDVTLATSDNINITNKHIKLTVGDGGDKTIERGSDNQDSLFTVNTGASLTLVAGNGKLTLDGNNISVGTPLVQILGGKLTIGDGVTLKNNNTTSGQSGGAVDVRSGTFYMTGGAICYNTSTTSKGGGVKLAAAEPDPESNPGSKFYMSGGMISCNTTISSGVGDHDFQNGGGVFIDHKSEFYMSGNAVISGNTADWGGGVYLYTGKFEMSGNAVISGNSATVYGGGVCQGHSNPSFGAGGTFTMSGGTIYGSDANDASLSNTVTDSNGGAAYYRHGGTAQYIDADGNSVEIPTPIEDDITR